MHMLDTQQFLLELEGSKGYSQYNGTVTDFAAQNGRMNECFSDPGWQKFLM